MKLVIDIPEEMVMALKQGSFDTKYNMYDLVGGIMNGTPLPKGHGRLIDADYLKDVILLHSYHGNDKNIVPYSDRKGYRLRQREVDEGIINAPTIIEKESE